MENVTHTVTIYEDPDRLAKEAIEKKYAILDLDAHLEMLWKVIPFQFEAAIKLMETALKFDCTETAELIMKDLRKSNPYLWDAYKNSHKPDASSADGSDNR